MSRELDMILVESMDSLLDSRSSPEYLNVNPNGSSGFSLSFEEFPQTQLESPEQTVDLNWIQPSQDFLTVDAPAQVLPDLAKSYTEVISTRMPAVEHVIPYKTPDLSVPENPRTLLARVMRRVIAGDSVQDIQKDERVASFPPAKVALEQAGLAGKVYVWASAYPDCHKGVGKDHVAKYASKARYLVAKDKCAGCTQAQDGRCAVFHKEIVVNVPWERALKDYAGVIEATKTASVGKSPQDTLKAALMRDAGVQAPKVTAKPQDHNRLKSVKAAEKFVRNTPEQDWHAHLVKTAQRFVKLGYVTSEEVNSNPRLAIAKATQLMTKVESRTYQGTDVAAPARKTARALTSAEKSALKYKAALAELQPLIKAGALTSLEARAHLDSGKSSFEIWKSAREVKVPEVTNPTYQGEGVHLARMAGNLRKFSENFGLSAEMSVHFQDPDTQAPMDLTLTGDWEFGGLK